MDWNKTNTILIVAFIIVNIFLFSVVVNNSFSEERTSVVNDQFVSDMKNILLDKNIVVHCDIPNTIYIEPFLEVEYKIYYPTEELIHKFIPEYDGPIDQDVDYYNIGEKSFEIKDGKKLIYTARKPSGQRPKDAVIDETVSKLSKVNNIDLSQYKKSITFVNNSAKVTLNQTYKDIGIANGYVILYIDDEGLYRFEMQYIVNITESKVKRSVISAPEAILRLMSYDNLQNKELISVDLWYYNEEGANWKSVNKINSDLTWLASFSDGTKVYLVGDD